MGRDLCTNVEFLTDQGIWVDGNLKLYNEDKGEFSNITLLEGRNYELHEVLSGEEFHIFDQHGERIASSIPLPAYRGEPKNPSSLTSERIEKLKSESKASGLNYLQTLTHITFLEYFWVNEKNKDYEDWVRVTRNFTHYLTFITEAYADLYFENFLDMAGRLRLVYWIL